MVLNFYPQIWKDLSASDAKLRAVCKVHLIRLRERQFGGLRMEKVTAALWELICWTNSLMTYSAGRGKSLD
jgi:hypothetical protein